MKIAAIMAGLLVAIAIGNSQASAQAGLATSGGVGGHNTIQQAPSGGRVGNGSAAARAGTDASGRPTEAERKAEQHNDSVTQICKGC